jgi:SAM-dependent methyltransferase
MPLGSDGGALQEWGMHAGGSDTRSEHWPPGPRRATGETDPPQVSREEGIMRRRTTLALVSGGATAAVAAGAFARSRYGGRGPEAPTPEEDAQYTLFAPGGSRGFWFNGPVGWAFAKIQPILHAGVYEAVAEMLDLQPEDELLDIGCGPGAFLASNGQRVRRVVGLDPSPVMLREAERRLADRVAAGTAQLVLGSSAALPFDDGEFSAVTVITAPANLAEVFRVLRPGGRFVFVDELISDPKRPPSERTAGTAVPWSWNEADFRRMLEVAGFADLTVRYAGAPVDKGVLHWADNRVVSCHKPAAS